MVPIRTINTVNERISFDPKRYGSRKKDPDILITE